MAAPDYTTGGIRNNSSTVPSGLANYLDRQPACEPELSEEELDRRIAELRPSPEALAAARTPVPLPDWEPPKHWRPREELSGLFPPSKSGESYLDLPTGVKWGTARVSGYGSNRYSRPGRAPQLTGRRETIGRLRNVPDRAKKAEPTHES